MNTMFSIYDAAKVELRDRTVSTLECGQDYYSATLAIKDKDGSEIVFRIYTDDTEWVPAVDVVGEIKDSRKAEVRSR